MVSRISVLFGSTDIPLKPSHHLNMTNILKCRLRLLPLLLMVATANGQVMRISLSALRQPSTKAGRKYCRLRKGDRVVMVQFTSDAETMFLASRKARLIHFSIEEVPILAGAGIGVRGLKLEAGDEVLGGMLLARPSDALHVVNNKGTQLSFGQMKYGVTGRGGKGVKTSMRNEFTEIIALPIELVDWQEIGED